MPPVGLLAIAALGLVLVYALPQRMRERADYAMVRTEDRFSSDMRVIRASVARMESRPARPASAGTRGAAPAKAKKQITSLGEGVMTRPAAPLDRAATRARREMVAMRRDRAKILARRRAQARRRGLIATVAILGSVGLWGSVIASTAPAWGTWAAVGTTTLFGSTVVAGRRSARAYAAADARLIPVATEVMVAATAAGALQRVSTERAVGHRAAPSVLETQAIRTLLAEDLAPAATPSPLPQPELPGVAQPAVGDPSWSPNTMPVPSYTLKPTAKPATPRPISEEDLEAGARAAEVAVDRRVAAETRASEGAEGPATRAADPQPATATLDQILARRRRQSA